LYTILKFIVNLDFFFFVILLSIDGFFVLFSVILYIPRIFRHFTCRAFYRQFPPNAGQHNKKEPLISPREYFFPET